MQNTSAAYQTIVAGDHWFETAVNIYTDSSTYTTIYESGIMSCKVTRPGMVENKPTVGGALSATLDLTIITPNFAIPKMAKIVTYFRATNRAQGATVTAENTSAWYPSGTFWVDTRAYDKSGIGTLTITAFDSMMKAEQDYPDTEHAWPYRDRYVVSEIASTIGVTVDSRTNSFLTAGWMIDTPTNYCMREVLESIAAMNGGNFIMTKDNKLLFVPLYGLDPEETLVGGYLTVEGSTLALQFGEEDWYILV